VTYRGSGRGGNGRLVTIINGAGRSEVAVNTPSSLPGPETLTIFYIDSTKAS
jgi:hypothetical protein